MKDRAHAMFDKALEIDPDYEPAKWNRRTVDALAEGKDVGMVSIQYGAARYLEEEARAKAGAKAAAAPAPGLVNALRRRLFGG